MASHDRSSARRFPASSGWSRLKPGSTDALESMGLPSKGETRLHDPKAQEAYYAKITDRYVKFCADCGTTAELSRQFASFSLHPSPTTSSPPPPPPPKPTPAKLQKPAAAAAAAASSPAPAAGELSILLSAMRKLREAIVSTHRTDHFAQRAYIFITRAAILVQSHPNYAPGLSYLLLRIHPRTPLPAAELHEFEAYAILDLACRQGDLGGAYAAAAASGCRDRRIGRLLAALAHDDWVAFWRVKAAVDGHQRRLMEWAEDGMRLHALKCLGRSYFTAERGYVERCADMAWGELVEKCGVGWELDESGERVTIRRPKGR